MEQKDAWGYSIDNLMTLSESPKKNSGFTEDELFHTSRRSISHYEEMSGANFTMNYDIKMWKGTINLDEYVYIGTIHPANNGRFREENKIKNIFSFVVLCSTENDDVEIIKEWIPGTRFVTYKTFETAQFGMIYSRKINGKTNTTMSVTFTYIKLSLIDIIPNSFISFYTQKGDVNYVPDGLGYSATFDLNFIQWNYDSKRRMRKKVYELYPSFQEQDPQKEDVLLCDDCYFHFDSNVEFEIRTKFSWHYPFINLQRMYLKVTGKSKMKISLSTKSTFSDQWKKEFTILPKTKLFEISFLKSGIPFELGIFLELAGQVDVTLSAGVKIGWDFSHIIDELTFGYELENGEAKHIKGFKNHVETQLPTIELESNIDGRITITPVISGCLFDLFCIGAGFGGGLGLELSVKPLEPDFATLSFYAVVDYLIEIDMRNIILGIDFAKLFHLPKKWEGILYRWDFGCIKNFGLCIDDNTLDLTKRSSRTKPLDGDKVFYNDMQTKPLPSKKYFLEVGKRTQAFKPAMGEKYIIYSNTDSPYDFFYTIAVCNGKCDVIEKGCEDKALVNCVEKFRYELNGEIYEKSIQKNDNYWVIEITSHENDIESFVEIYDCVEKSEEDIDKLLPPVIVGEQSAFVFIYKAMFRDNYVISVDNYITNYMNARIQIYTKVCDVNDENNCDCEDSGFKPFLTGNSAKAEIKISPCENGFKPNERNVIIIIKAFGSPTLNDGDSKFSIAVTGLEELEENFYGNLEGISEMQRNFVYEKATFDGFLISIESDYDGLSQYEIGFSLYAGSLARFSDSELLIQKDITGRNYFLSISDDVFSHPNYNSVSIVFNPPYSEDIKGFNFLPITQLKSGRIHKAGLSMNNDKDTKIFSIDVQREGSSMLAEVQMYLFGDIEKCNMYNYELGIGAYQELNNGDFVPLESFPFTKIPCRSFSHYSLSRSVALSNSGIVFFTLKCFSGYESDGTTYVNENNNDECEIDFGLFTFLQLRNEQSMRFKVHPSEMLYLRPYDDNYFWYYYDFDLNEGESLQAMVSTSKNYRIYDIRFPDDVYVELSSNNNNNIIPGAFQDNRFIGFYNSYSEGKYLSGTIHTMSGGGCNPRISFPYFEKLKPNFMNIKIYGLNFTLDISHCNSAQSFSKTIYDEKRSSIGKFFKYLSGGSWWNAMQNCFFEKYNEMLSEQNLMYLSQMVWYSQNMRKMIIFIPPCDDMEYVEDTSETVIVDQIKKLCELDSACGSFEDFDGANSILTSFDVRSRIEGDSGFTIKSSNGCPISDCSEHGDCISKICICDDDWYGSGCESPKCNGKIKEERCSSHGECNSDHICECFTEEWYGDYCEKPTCNGKKGDERCYNGGVCGLDHICVCDVKFWYGDYCKLPKCNGKKGNDGCENGGICKLDHNCSCNSQWYGDFCQIPKCNGKEGDERCLNGGECNEDHLCRCEKKWEGEYCQIPICFNERGEQVKCLNGGTCSDAHTCDCMKTQFIGPTCSDKLPQNSVDIIIIALVGLCGGLFVFFFVCCFLIVAMVVVVVVICKRRSKSMAYSKLKDSEPSIHNSTIN